MTSDTDETSKNATVPKKLPLWLWPNLLSLDAPIVAVVWQWWFALCLRVHIPWQIYATLGLTVWIIYVADRLYDGMRLKSVEKSTARHQFYRKYAAIFAVLLVIGIVIDVWLIRHHVPIGLYWVGIPIPDLLANPLLAVRVIFSRPGLVLGFFVWGYFVLRIFFSRRSQSGAPREVMCGFIFALGSIIAVYFYGGDVADVFFRSPPPVLLGLLFSANCIAIAHWEKAADRANEDTSLATSRPATGRDLPFFLGLIALAALVMQLLSFPNYGWPIYTAIFLSALGLLALKLMDQRLSTNALRVLADAVLILPMIPLVLFIA